MTTPNVGDEYATWWDKKARVLGVYPYTGRYPQHFTHVLRLSAENTRRGWLEMAVDLRSQA